METKQTAVQLLKERLPSLFTDDNNGFYSKLFEQAIQMEREQIYNAWNDGCCEGIEGGQSTNCEEYYGEKFGENYGGKDE